MLKHNANLPSVFHHVSELHITRMQRTHHFMPLGLLFKKKHEKKKHRQEP